MIKLLKSRGYNFVYKNTVNNREFRKVNEEYTINEDYSTFAQQVYDLVEEYELFLKKEAYTEKKIREILNATRNEIQGKMVDIAMTNVKQENGYLITFIITKRGT